MKILYIPFSLEMAAVDLMKKAILWKTQYAIFGKEEPLILTHDAITAEQAPLIAAALLSGTCQIYIQAHGMDSPELTVCNQELHDAHFQILSINEVARRLHYDLGKFIWHPNTSIKLYYCDPYGQGKAKRMAESFSLTLLGNLHYIKNIFYYSDVNLSIPHYFNAEFGLIKQARKSFTFEHDLFRARLDCFTGQTKLHRHHIMAPAVGFFVPNIALVYPEYSHPLLKIIVEQLVHAIQISPTLAGTKNSICQALINEFPTDMDGFSLYGNIIANEYFSLQLQLSAELIGHFAKLGHLGVIVEPIPMPRKLHPAFAAPESILALVDMKDKDAPRGLGDVMEDIGTVPDALAEEDIGHDFSM